MPRTISTADQALQRVAALLRHQLRIAESQRLNRHDAGMPDERAHGRVIGLRAALDAVDEVSGEVLQRQKEEITRC